MNGLQFKKEKHRGSKISKEMYIKASWGRGRPKKGS